MSLDNHDEDEILTNSLKDLDIYEKETSTASFSDNLNMAIDMLVENYNEAHKEKIENLEWNNIGLHNFYDEYFEEYIARNKDIFKHYEDNDLKKVILHAFNSLSEEIVWGSISNILLINLIDICFEGEHKTKFYAWLTKITGSFFNNSSDIDYGKIITQVASVLISSQDDDYFNNLTDYMTDVELESKNDLAALYLRVLLPANIDEGIISNLVGLIKVFTPSSETEKPSSKTSMEQINEDDPGEEDVDEHTLKKLIEAYNQI